MVEKIEDLYLPTSVVARLIKEALPSSASVSKEARIAISRAASVFAIYLTSTATTMKNQTKNKTITANDILECLNQMEFEGFIGPLSEHLTKYRKTIKDKKDAKAAENKAKKDQESSLDVNPNNTDAEIIETEQIENKDK